LGHYLTQKKVFQPLEQVRLPQKTVKYSPTQKLITALIGILAGCKALYQLNVKVRPDRPLQAAFGWECCADQSTVSETLDCFTAETVTQLRMAGEAIQRQQSGVFAHDYENELLILEVDLTGLGASQNAEGSTKGYFPGKRNRRGRQLLRVAAPQYEEVLFERLYPGNTSSREVLKEALSEMERILGLDEAKRKRTLIRLDGGFGTDENLNWLCWRGYQFIVKGYSGSRAKKVAATVPEGDWRGGPTPGQELGVPAQPHRYGRRIVTVARRWRDENGKLYQDLLITTLMDLSPEEIAKLYDQRGGMEVDIRGDKRGLHLEGWRKKRFYAQEALVLLAQLAHNLLVWYKRWFLSGTKAAGLGVERLLEEVLAMPAQIRVGRWRARVRLLLPTLHPWASAVAKGIGAHYPPSGWRAIWGQN
jgi:hypothetical protein